MPSRAVGEGHEEADGDESSGSCESNDMWEAMESNAMMALEARLEELCPAGGGHSGQDARRAEAEASSADARHVQSDEKPLADFSKALLDEPYRPEDHVLTAEEMWGGLSSGDEGEEEEEQKASPSLPAVAEKKLQLDRSQSSSNRRSPMADTRPAGVSAPSASDDGERLRRVLAGAAAAQELNDLNFAELSAVADDCSRAVETLRWVLQRQRQLLGTT
eukprot:gnl/TRDRNA2_/TRDRNA2_177878_c1_seq1.p1 gnl/TRDRNA2_/TRDRNA2_177878_c1~~gnl/TRDRNA2_/TRDRNA2_177878_c1_seq1.p1  ORF type:complete len:219 (+),score=58.75 gnl/TRDRNA2_/TRDRNA2_177878_c1_seq1:28-684(+)